VLHVGIETTAERYRVAEESVDDRVSAGRC
jgi:hypothetical protein